MINFVITMESCIFVAYFKNLPIQNAENIRTRVGNARFSYS